MIICSCGTKNADEIEPATLEARAVVLMARATQPRKPMSKKPTAPAAVRAYLAEIGKVGGKSKSPAKLAAIAKNAKKGGWPKGRPRKPLKDSPAAVPGNGILPR